MKLTASVFAYTFVLSQKAFFSLPCKCSFLHKDNKFTPPIAVHEQQQQKPHQHFDKNRQRVDEKTKLRNNLTEQKIRQRNLAKFRRK